MERLDIRVDKEQILLLLMIHNTNYINILEPTKELIKNSIYKIKHDIKMCSSVSSDKYKDRIDYEIKNLMSLQTYLILNYGIDEL
ncbi:hypothetical protein [Paraclostridium bifermentans]|uniref:hypothetical protein n=1 Tax=Paraclostridium bifermentans TaxID=1490 RepID=UPI0018975B09|nr:hypothetical protein [Paraclostridium bifermentans]